jgi:hypothetical protein
MHAGRGQVAQRTHPTEASLGSVRVRREPSTRLLIPLLALVRVAGERGALLGTCGEVRASW